MNSTTTPPAAEWAHSVTIASNEPADGLGNIQALLPKLLSSGPQDLRTAAALAQLAAQCLKLLEHRLPIFNHDYSDIVGHARWVDEAVYLKDDYGLPVYEDKWQTDPINYLEKVSAPVYELARDLEDLAVRSGMQGMKQLESAAGEVA